jgi:hypothetical protein
LSLFQK